MADLLAPPHLKTKCKPRRKSDAPLTPPHPDHLDPKANQDGRERVRQGGAAAGCHNLSYATLSYMAVLAEASVPTAQGHASAKSPKHNGMFGPNGRITVGPRSDLGRISGPISGPIMVFVIPFAFA